MKRSYIPNRDIVEAGQLLIQILRDTREQATFGYPAPMPIDPLKCTLVSEPTGYTFIIPSAPPFHSGLTLIISNSGLPRQTHGVICISTENCDSWAITGPSLIELCKSPSTVGAILRDMVQMIVASPEESNENINSLISTYSRPAVGMAHARTANPDDELIARAFAEALRNRSQTIHNSQAHDHGEFSFDMAFGNPHMVTSGVGLPPFLRRHDPRLRSSFGHPSTQHRHWDASGNLVHSMEESALRRTRLHAKAASGYLNPRKEVVKLPSYYNLVGGSSFTNLLAHSGVFITELPSNPVLVLPAPMKHSMVCDGEEVELSMDVHVILNFPNATTIAQVAPDSVVETLSRCGKRFGKDLLMLTGFDLEAGEAGGDVLIAELQTSSTPFDLILRLSYGAFAPGNAALVFGFEILGETIAMTLLIPMRNDDIAVGDDRFPLRGTINLTNAKGAFNWLYRLGTELIELPRNELDEAGQSESDSEPLHAGMRPGYNPSPRPKTEAELRAGAIARERFNRPAPGGNYHMNPNTK